MSRPPVASRTKFEALAVDSGDSSEEELEVVELDSATESAVSTLAVPLTRTAQKKAAKAARLAKKESRRGSASPSPSPQLDTLKALPVTPGENGIPADRAVPTSSSLVTEISAAPAVVEDEGDLSANGYVNAGGIQDAQSTVDPAMDAVSPVTENTVRESLEEEPKPTAGEKELDPFLSRSPSGVSVASALSVNEVALSEDQKAAQKSRKNVFERTIWTFIMIGGFLTLLVLGHGYMIVLVMLIQALVYREVTALFSLGARSAAEQASGRDPWSKTLSWYFWAIANYYLYGESIIYYFKHVVFSDAQLLPFATNHRFISFMLYIFGFVGFVGSLDRKFLRQQFGLFCWVHMSLLLIVFSSHFVMNNILEGMIWFWVPASLVIFNDIFAYICGKLWGRTPLIALSPKKTVEGFVGAFISTVIFGIVWGTVFSQYKYMTCPVHELGVSAWDPLECHPNPVFEWREWAVPVGAKFITSMVGNIVFGKAITSIPYMTYQFHLLVMSCFASLVAPFGGFFASGFKRAFDIKDFGDSIPGHGGMTDRMDCQFLMGVWTFVYYSSLIRENHATVGSVLQTIVSSLTVEQQVELMRDFRHYMDSKGITV